MIQQHKLFARRIPPCFVRFSSTNLRKPDQNIRFDSLSASYAYKTKRDLFRGWFVFKLCSYTKLVDRLSQIFTISRYIVGQRLFESIMRTTIYGHFVAGRDKTELKPIVERLRKHRVKLILDYCMESDITSNKLNVNSVKSSSLNTDMYDENTKNCIKNVQTAADLCGSSAIIAVKLTAFVPPNILQKLNQTVEENKQLSIVELLSKATTMTQNEISEVQLLLKRINRIIQEVKNTNGKIFIDAEQSYFQTAIHKLVLELQQEYNRDRLIVYNTYQCYRKITVDVLREDLLESRKRNFHIGFKLVRGAYMDQERKRAVEMKSFDPIHPNFSATTDSYHQAFAETLHNAKNSSNQIHVFVASHNEDTLQYALQTMHSMNIKPSDGLVSFATLFGMCDYLTFPLASIVSFTLATMEYDAYKLTPYGPVDRLLPYLTRRAQENRAIFAKAEKDRRLHYEALKDRFLS